VSDKKIDFKLPISYTSPAFSAIFWAQNVAEKNHICSTLEYFFSASIGRSILNLAQVEEGSLSIAEYWFKN
jgi:hypothetical protein